MTREEAIDILNGMFCSLCSLQHPRRSHDENLTKLREIREEALDMAIEALQNEPTPCEKCIHVKSCRKVIILKNRTYKLVKYCSQGAERRKP